MTHHAGQHGLFLDAPRLERSSASAFRCSSPHATCDLVPASVGPLLAAPCPPASCSGTTPG